MTFLLSPLILSLIAVAVIFAVVLFVLDSRRSGHQKQLRKHMLAFVIKNAMKSFSVVIESDGTLESLDPILTHLEEHNYSKLQVIILASATIDKKAISQLRKLQRQKKGSLQMRIVRRKSTGNDRALFRRYATGDAIVWLNAEDRLSKDFFTRMSLELLDESCEAISPRMAFAVNDTLTSASRALNQVANQTVTSLFGRTIAKPIVMRRESYLSDAVNKTFSVEHSTITSKEMPAKYTNGLTAVILLVSIILVIGVSFTFLPFSWYIVSSAYIGSIVLLMVLRLLTYPYSAWNKLALVLMIPLWPLIALAIAGGRVTRRLVSRVFNQKSGAARLQE